MISEHAVLTVDDEPANCRAVRRTLADDCRVLSAGSGAEALALMACEPVALVITDQRMPGMSGTELLSRAKMLYPDTVRIVLSGYTDLATVTAAINEGAIYKFLTKPWEHDALREDIRLAFHHHEQRTANQAALRAAPANP